MSELQNLYNVKWQNVKEDKVYNEQLRYKQIRNLLLTDHIEVHSITRVVEQ